MVPKIGIQKPHPGTEVSTTTLLSGKEKRLGLVVNNSKIQMIHQNKVAVAYVDEKFLAAVKERQDNEEKIVTETKAAAAASLNEFYEQRNVKLQQRRRNIEAKEKVLLQEREFTTVKDEFVAVKYLINTDEVSTTKRYLEVLISYIYEN